MQDGVQGRYVQGRVQGRVQGMVKVCAGWGAETG